MQVRFVGYVIIFIVFVSIIEALSYIFFRLDLELVRRRTYNSPRVTVEQFQDYINTRHPILGWPSSRLLALHTDEWGARTSPANEKLSTIPDCVSLYGDSFTFSSGASNENAWPNLLALHLGCRVLNYGMFGYGVGQAVMRFGMNEIDDAPITILGIFPSNLKRSMNQWSFLLSGTEPLGFKPRYKVKDNQLILISIPVNTYQDFLRIVEKPELLLDEYFLPGRGIFGSDIITSFPYTFSLVKLMAKVLSQIDLEKISVHTPIRYWNYPPIYDDPGGPSEEKIFLNKKIVERFREICEERNKRCFVLLIPDKDALRMFEDRLLSKEMALKFGEYVEI